MARFRKNDFFKWAQKIKSVFCFIPHTHEGCDFTIRVYHKVLVVSIHTPTKGVTLEHEGCPATFCCFNPHTHEGCDSFHNQIILNYLVSIHTPTKGVTERGESVTRMFKFQSTHPRRV